MKQHPREIPLEHFTTLDAERSAEVARIWITDGGGCNVLIAAGVLGDPKAFGQLMADTMRNAARAYALTYGGEPRDMLRQFLDGLTEDFPDRFVKLENRTKGDLN